MMHVMESFKHLIIPLEVVKIATHNFSDKNLIGFGGFGSVYKGELMFSDVHTIVALKRLDPKFGQGNPEFWKEIVTLSLYKHKNIVSLLGFCDESGEKILVYEYASRGSLDAYVDSNDLGWLQRLNICIQAASGLAYLHDPGSIHQRLLHRDVKSANILLDENWNARISDFGLSKFGPADQQYTFLVTNTVGTFGYCDPEYMKTAVLTKESDVYSFGVVLFEVLCGRLSYHTSSDESVLPFTSLVRKYYEEKKMSEILHDSIKNEISNTFSLDVFTKIGYECLSMDPKERPLMTEVLSKLKRSLQYHSFDTTGDDSVYLRESNLAKEPIGNHGKTWWKKKAATAVKKTMNVAMDEASKLLDGTLENAGLKVFNWRVTHKEEASELVDLVNEVGEEFDKWRDGKGKAELLDEVTETLVGELDKWWDETGEAEVSELVDDTLEKVGSKLSKWFG